MDKACHHGSVRAAHGVTLIELVTTVGVMLVVLGVAVPGLYGLIEGNRVTSAVNRIVTHLHTARSEAVTRGRRAALCPSRDNTTCSGGFDWSDGAILFVDDNGDGTRQPGEARLRSLPGSPAGIEILTSSGRRRIVYEPDGSVLGGSNATFRVCSRRDARRNRAVMVSLPGRPRVSHRTAGGSAIRCN